MLDDRFSDQFSQPRLTELGFVRPARRMMLVSAFWHPLDNVLAMFGDVHFDPTAYAHAPRSFRRVVDSGKRVLQRWIMRCVRPTFDQESLRFHTVSRASAN